MISGSGRCHGPGCTRPASVPFWCSEACAGAWDRQYGGATPLPGFATYLGQHGGWIAAGDLPDDVSTVADLDWTRRSLLAGTGATKPLVASEDPQVGFLGKWINRIRRGR